MDILQQISAGVLALFSLIGGMFHTPEVNLGAFGDPFLSIQLATSPSNGNCLTTDGTNNAWGSCGSGGGSDPFTHSTNFGTVNSATTTAIWGQGGFHASSTSRFSTTTVYTQDDDGFQVNGNVTNHLALFRNTGTGASHLSFCNADTGCATTDGVDFGMRSTANGNSIILRNRETAGLLVEVGGTTDAFTIDSAGTAIQLNQYTTNGIVLTSGSNGTLTVDATPLNVANGGTGQTTLATSELLYGAGTAGIQSVATGTVSAGNGISLDSSVRSVIGGALQISNSGVLSNVAGSGITVSGATGNVTVSTNDRDDIATSTGLTISELAYYTKTGGLTTFAGVATTTASCAGTNSCTAFTILGSAPVTITGSGGGTFGQDWDMFTKGFIAPTSTASVVIGATTTPSLNRNALFQVNATSTTGNLIVASSTLDFTGDYFRAINSAGTALLRVNADGAVLASNVFDNTSGTAGIELSASNGINITDTVNGKFSFQGVTNDLGWLYFNSLSADREYVFPDVTGTVGIGTSTTTPNLAYWASNGSLGSVATGTISSANSALTVTGSRYSVGGATTFTVSTTTTTMFTGTAGQVLGYTNLGWTGVATTTAGTGLTYTGSAFNVNTTQNITALSNLTTNALIVTSGGNGTLGAYAGIDCTNQFVRDVAATGAGTCATVGAADVSLANLTATDSTLTFSGTYNGSTARTIGLNLANANTWTALQTFNRGAGLPGIVSNSLVGIGTTTPKWAMQIASSTGAQLTLSDGSNTSNHWSFRSINNYLYIATSSAGSFATSTFASLQITRGGLVSTYAIQPATSTALVLDWTDSPNQVEYRIGASATTITLINATTSAMWGSTKRVYICNPDSTAGALTWVGVRWIGTAPTQTTTASKCDLYSFNVTRATSTTVYIVAGAQSAGL